VPETEVVAAVANAVGAEEVAVDARSLVAEKGMIDELTENGLQTQVWTVNRAPSAHRLAEMGVSAISTDYPGHLVSSFHKLNPY
jgi:glycerophosphoryl diester phosphodiesterase